MTINHVPNQLDQLKDCSHKNNNFMVIQLLTLKKLIQTCIILWNSIGATNSLVTNIL